MSVVMPGQKTDVSAPEIMEEILDRLHRELKSNAVLGMVELQIQLTWDID